MKTTTSLFTALALFLLVPLTVQADLDVGKAAPAIVSKDLSGKEWKLEDQRGKYVVLEWFNPDCPYVKKFYNAGTVAKQQKRLTEDGIVWVTIYSNKDRENGAKSAADLKKIASEWKAEPSVTLYDVPAVVAKNYSAKTTPHIFIINPEGVLIYRGAIDSISSDKAADIAKAENYIDRTLAEVKSGKAVSKPVTKPYGCGVKL